MATTTFKGLDNNAAGTLSASIVAGDGTCDLQAGEGAEFPSSGTFWVTLYGSTIATNEVVLCTSRSTDELTITRAQQGTAARDWPENTNVQLLWTKSNATDIQTAINNIEDGTTTLATMTATGAATSATAVIGGGYGSTGASIAADGDIQTNGDLTVDGFVSVGTFLNLKNGGELTIAGGSITATSSHHTIDTEADGTPDYLDTIEGGSAGDILLLHTVTGARDVILQDFVSGGNLQLAGSCTLGSANDSILLRRSGVSTWCEICRSINGG